MKTLKKHRHQLSDPAYQLELINSSSESLRRQPRFREKLQQVGLAPLKPIGIEIFQMNLGYMCNMTCKHCHVDAGPDRKEIMQRETFKQCLKVIKESGIETVDLTGGAPEMNPHFRWFVKEVTNLGKTVIVRSNLTILMTNRYWNLPEFFARHEVEVVCSLPFYSRSRTDRQRGNGTYDRSIEALKRLNAVGYGKEESGLILNLVYNPVGAYMPGSQEEMEQDFKGALQRKHGIIFNHLFTITNLPISRFLQFLRESGNLEDYMERLVAAFSPAAARGVMCRNTISVGWDGFLYDCDFNQMLEINIDARRPQHICEWNEDRLNGRNIQVNQHCYGCTAGAGSSCGGAITQDGI